MIFVGDGSAVFSDRIVIEGNGSSPFVVGAGWLLEIIEIESGEYYFFRDGRSVCPNCVRFGVFYPSYSIVSVYVKRFVGKADGIGGVGSANGLPGTPIVFETDFEGPFTNAGQVSEIAAAARNIRSIELNSKPSLLSIRAKRLIDDAYRLYPSIGRIAARLGVSGEHLSRQFKRDFEMGPSKYLHHLRMAEATFRLSAGEEIIDISNEVGYNELSRFYKQFRDKNKTSPGRCRAELNRQG